MTDVTAKRGRISSNQLFFILFTVRLYSLLINLSSLTDFALSFALSLVLCLLAELVSRHVKNSRAFSILLGVICFALTVQTVISYITFTNDAVHPEFNTLLLVGLIALSVAYASSLKIEALARFSLFSGTVLILAVAAALLTNLKDIDVKGITATDFSLGLSIYKCVKCLDLPVLYLALKPSVNRCAYSSLKLGVLGSYAVAAAVLLWCTLIMGTAFRVYPYPAFTLFQLAGIGSFSRLDVVFTGSMLLALFLKCSVLLYCSINCVTGGEYEKA